MSIRSFKQMPADVREWSVFFRDTTVNADTAVTAGSASNVTGVVGLVNGGTGATTAPLARTSLGLGSLSTLSSVNNGNWSGTALSIPNGGTGQITATAALSALGGAAASTGSYTGTLTGCTTSPTGSVVYTKSGSVVVLAIPQINATSNSTAATITGAPALLQPARIQVVPLRLQDNSVVIVGYVRVDLSGVLTLFPNVSLGNFTAAGTKGTEVSTVTYALD